MTSRTGFTKASNLSRITKSVETLAKGFCDVCDMPRPHREAQRQDPRLSFFFSNTSRTHQTSLGCLMRRVSRLNDGMMGKTALANIHPGRHQGRHASLSKTYVGLTNAIQNLFARQRTPSLNVPKTVASSSINMIHTVHRTFGVVNPVKTKAQPTRVSGFGVCLLDRLRFGF